MTRDIGKRADEIRNETDDVKAWDMMMELIESFIFGWENVNDAQGNPLPFTRENLDDRLQDVELWELVNSAPYASTPSEADQKN